MNCPESPFNNREEKKATGPAIWPDLFVDWRDYLYISGFSMVSTFRN